MDGRFLVLLPLALCGCETASQRVAKAHALPTEQCVEMVDEDIYEYLPWGYYDRRHYYESMAKCYPRGSNDYVEWMAEAEKEAQCDATDCRGVRRIVRSTEALSNMVARSMNAEAAKRRGDTSTAERYRQGSDEKTEEMTRRHREAEEREKGAKHSAALSQKFKNQVPGQDAPSAEDCIVQQEDDNRLERTKDRDQRDLRNVRNRCTFALNVKAVNRNDDNDVIYYRIQPGHTDFTYTMYDGSEKKYFQHYCPGGAKHDRWGGCIWGDADSVPAGPAEPVVTSTQPSTGTETVNGKADTVIDATGGTTSPTTGGSGRPSSAPVSPFFEQLYGPLPPE